MFFRFVIVVSHCPLALRYMCIKNNNKPLELSPIIFVYIVYIFGVCRFSIFEGVSPPSSRNCASNFEEIYSHRGYKGTKTEG